MAHAFVISNPSVSSNRSFGSRICYQHAPSSFTGTHFRLMPRSRTAHAGSLAWVMKIGIFYSTTTGNTEEVANAIKDTLGSEASEPMEVGDTEASKLAEFDMLFIGAPTWNTDADSERTGTSWDQFLYEELPSLDLTGKPVAVFGLGDAVDYAPYFCDAMEEVHDCFAKQGAKMVGYTPADAYKFEESKSVRDGSFLGLPFDAINGPYDVDERVGPWCKEAVKEAGI